MEGERERYLTRWFTNQRDTMAGTSQAKARSLLSSWFSLGQEAQHLSHPPLLFIGHWQRAAVDMEPLGLEPVFIGDAALQVLPLPIVLQHQPQGKAFKGKRRKAV